MMANINVPYKPSYDYVYESPQKGESPIREYNLAEE
jgi:hypothetical protein